MKQTANQKEMVEREVDMNSGHAAGNEGMSYVPRYLGLFFSAALLMYMLVVEHRVTLNNPPNFPHSNGTTHWRRCSEDCKATDSTRFPIDITNTQYHYDNNYLHYFWEFGYILV